MKKHLDSLFSNIEEIPLFYIESGSRLWGIASPDSDFDVRGIHLQSKKQYFDFKKHRDIIEVMDGDFDFVSYDIDKMFGLLGKSNPTVFEWVRSNIVYFNELPDWTTFQKEIIANIDFKVLFYHYSSLVKGELNLMEKDKKFTYKKAFYCIRGLLSADLSAKRVLPELLIDDLFNQFERENHLITIAKDSLERKKQQTEKEEVLETDKNKILTSIKEYMAHLLDKAPESSNNKQKLESILTDYCYNLKFTFYK